MDTIRPGELVKVADDGPERDGIVFDTPSALKVVVGIVDPRRGPMFRTVHPRTLTERLEAGPDDPALRLLLRRTPPPARREGRDGNTARYGREGHARATGHRTTGK